MVFCDSVSSHCTRVSRSVRCPRSFRADSAGSFTARTVLIAGRACLNGVSAHLFVNLSGGMHKGTCPGWFARLKHAHACFLEWGSLERIPAGTGPSSSPDLQLLDFGRTSLPPLPCQDTGELNFVGWYKSLAGSSVVLSAAWHDFQARAAGTLLAVEFPAVRPAGTRHAFIICIGCIGMTRAVVLSDKGSSLEDGWLGRSF